MTRPPRPPGPGRPGRPPPRRGAGRQERNIQILAARNGRGGPAAGSALSPGISQSFAIGQRDRVERALVDLEALSVDRLRTGISWAGWHAEGGEQWYTWLLHRLAENLEVLPFLHSTPPDRGVEGAVSSPPRRPRDFADFTELLISRLGECFTTVELWNEPNSLSCWDRRLDRDLRIFTEMITGAARVARQRGKRVVLGASCPTDTAWLELMCERRVPEVIDIVGVHGYPGTWEFDWKDWKRPIGRVREVLREHDHEHPIWITEAGYSTWRHDPVEQLRAFRAVRRAPADRAYWSSLYDRRPKDGLADVHREGGFGADERAQHLGLKGADGAPKLLFRGWSGQSAEGVGELLALTDGEEPEGTGAPAVGGPGERGERPVLVTGGAGFIGSNLADRLLSGGERVRVYDSLARAGVERNLRWLRSKHGDRLEVRIGDVRDRPRLREAVTGTAHVFHLAAQVAVTTSEDDPSTDFDVNVAGTLHLLEALREMDDPPPLVFTSTNKVYGALRDLELRVEDGRYQPVELPARSRGISEARPLAFRSPYGCSKGAADQYVLDYARSFGLRALVFRMSCIYGPRQFGTEDQGWVAHFLIRALENDAISIFGDGRQVRDILFVDDLMDAFLLARDRIDELSGRAFNIGGGRDNAVSLLEVLDLIDRLHGTPELRFEDWRTGDQRWYVSDTSRFREMTGWEPTVGHREGIERLLRWLGDRSEITVREDASVRSAG